MSKKSLGTLRIAALLLALATFPLSADSPRKVSLLLRWDHQYQFAGYYAAKWLGYYDEAGLEVDIRPGLDEKLLPLPVVEEVAAGRADFGIGAADILMGKERGLELVVFATILQKSPVRFYSLGELRLESPADFIGRRVGRNPKDLVDVELLALLGSSGISTDSIRSSPLRAGPGPLLSGEVEIAGGYAINFPFALEKLGRAYHSLDPADFGVDFCGDSLFTSAELLRREPELVRRFREASLKGWKYALEHPEDMIERILRLPRRSPSPEAELRAINRFQARTIAPFILHPYVELGSSSTARWQAMQERLAEVGLLSRPFDSAMIYDPAARSRRRIQLRDEFLALIIALGTALTLVLLALNTLLRRLVKRRTAELEAALAKEELALAERGEALIAKDEALAGKDLLMKEIHHRIKNNLALVSSLVSLQASRFEEPRLREALDMLQLRIDSVARIHERLYKGDSAVEVELAPYLRDLCEHLAEAEGPGGPELSLELGPGRINAKEALALGLIFTELVSNAYKHAFPDGRKGKISIGFGLEAESYLLRIEDDGVGMSAESGEKEGSFGLLLVNSLAAQLGAGLESRSDGSGTSFRLSFPAPHLLGTEIRRQ